MGEGGKKKSCSSLENRATGVRRPPEQRLIKGVVVKLYTKKTALPVEYGWIPLIFIRTCKGYQL